VAGQRTRKAYQLIFLERRRCMPLNCSGDFARRRAEWRERRE
jgi:hypothetical protein